MIPRKLAESRFVPANAPVRIAADTKNWPHANAELVVFESGLKDDPTPNTAHYRGGTGERGSARLVVAGGVSSSCYSELIRTPFYECNARPYLARYVLVVTCWMNTRDAALERMRTRYVPQPTGGDAGPALLLSGNAAEIRPIERAYSRFVTEPQLGDLSLAHAVVPAGHEDTETDVFAFSDGQFAAGRWTIRTP